MDALAKHDLITAFLLLCLATTTAGVALGEWLACLGALSSFVFCWLLIPATVKQAVQSGWQGYVAFTTWALPACFVGTVAVVAALFIAAWLFDWAPFVGLGLKAFLCGTVAFVLIGFPLCFRVRPHGFGKAPQGLPDAEVPKQEAAQWLASEWGKQGEP